VPFEYTDTMADLFPELLKCSHENIGVVEWISGYTNGKPDIMYLEHKCYECNRVVKRVHFPSFEIMFSELEEDKMWSW
jgi:hypothetical protein